MNTLWLCLIATCAVASNSDDEFAQGVTIRRATPLLEASLRGAQAAEELMIRGQEPTYDPNPQNYAPLDSYTPPAQPFGQPSYQSDPFLGQGDPGTYGVYGPQPTRYGWSGRFDAGWLPEESAKGVAGNFSVVEFNAALRHSVPWWQSTFSVTPEAAIRLWEGPSGVGLPGTVYRIGSDFELASNYQGPWNFQLGFTPSIATDFGQSFDRQTFLFDGRGLLFYRANPQWMFAFGAMYWDRVKDRVLPTGGVVWTPNDRWEFRLLFPKSRISYFLGSYNGTAWWFYGAAEYNIEAYQVEIGPTDYGDQMEIEDYRLLLGLRTESGGVAGFVEGGWVLDRHVRFRDATPDFGINDGWVLRAGIRF